MVVAKQRIDAVRNRQRVLDAAEEVLAVHGLSARMDEIARHAGVGVGTLYRHFPTKEVLYQAILLARVQRLLQEAEQLQQSGDPGTAFFTLFARIVDQSVSKHPLGEALTDAGVAYKADPAMQQAQHRMRTAIEELQHTAQRAGTLRPEIALPETLALLAGATLTAERTSWDQDVRDRALRVIFNGLRPS
jgi:AcrR family transcriptional regulator